MTSNHTPSGSAGRGFGSAYLIDGFGERGGVAATRLQAIAPISALAPRSPDGARWQGISPFVTTSVVWSLYAFLRAPRDYHTDYSWSPDSARLASVGGNVLIWDAKTLQRVAQLGQPRRELAQHHVARAAGGLRRDDADRAAGPGRRLRLAQHGQCGACQRLPRLVLVAEDDEVNALIVGAYLDSLGVRYERVADGKQAVSRALRETDRPELVLMDCRMPVMDGLAATADIRRQERTLGLPRLPILALTATASEADRLACMESGMDSVIAKPFTPVQLADALRGAARRLVA